MIFAKSRKAAAAILLYALLSGDPLRAQKQGELDTGFQITLSERTETPLGIEAVITSTRVYPFAGYSLRCGVTSSPDTIDISINGMVHPSPSVPLAAEATGKVFLGNTRIERTILRVSYRGQSDFHRLLRTARGLEAVPLRASFTRVTVAAQK